MGNRKIVKASGEFQVFAKPAGSVCNLGCDYCYYLKKEHLYPGHEGFRMPDDILEEYIVQHIAAYPGPVINFSWHGGEPTLLGLDYFHKITALQRRHKPAGQRITNGMQTNGTRLDEHWGRFLAEENFSVGLSLDGPEEIHDLFRVTKDRKPTHRQVMRGYEILQKHNIPCDVLCVVNAQNVRHPIRVYRFFQQIKARYIGFLPLVEPRPDAPEGVSERTVPAKSLGAFLCAIFDEWKQQDIGRIKVQLFEEAARTAFNQEHALCIFRETCGEIPVVEHNGDFYSCDHFVSPEHLLGNIRQTPLVDLLESPAQKAFGQAKLITLPRYCRNCPVRLMCHGGCPKDRFIHTPEGEAGLNYLCEGYRRFFDHCRPFVAELAALWRGRSRQDPSLAPGAPVAQIDPKIGRNDPCPCGSGRKYKKCCLGKVPC
ncbi:MAG: anaerobic sulfatase maturase [Desulfobacterales bacterium]|nr:anaerobic sulfatase maturase [Desulfobacterales bacterium]